MINVRIAGAGGQGVILASVLLAKGYGIGESFNIAQTQSYGPEARGGACKAEVIISDEEIDYMKVDKADVFVALNQSGYNKYIDAVKEDAIILINSTLVESTNIPHYKIEATRIAEEMGNPYVVNIIVLGALTKLMPKVHFEAVVNEIRKNFSDGVAEINCKAFERGYEEIKKQVILN